MPWSQAAALRSAGANAAGARWPHVIANFAYVIAAAGLLAWLAYAVVERRQARVERFSGAKAAQRYGRVRQTVAVVGGLVGLLAALSIVVAVA